MNNTIVALDHSTTAVLESRLLGLCVLDGDARSLAIAALSGNDFSVDRHRLVWSELSRLGAVSYTHLTLPTSDLV